MCYNIQTSIVSFCSAMISGILSLYLNQNVLGCLILAYGVMQFSEILIWRGINTKNKNLNKIGTMVGKFTLPSHNIAIGIGILITYWVSKNNLKYWVPLIVGFMFYCAVMIIYSNNKRDKDITEACEYDKNKKKNSCTKNSARLKWPYSHGWYSISFLISIIICFLYVKPFPIALVIILYFGISLFLTTILGKSQIMGSYWCWSAAAFAPVIVLVVYLMKKRYKNEDIKI